MFCTFFRTFLANNSTLFFTFPPQLFPRLCHLIFSELKRGGEQKNKTQKEQEKQERGTYDLAFSMVITNQNARRNFFRKSGFPVQSDFSGLKSPGVCQVSV